MANVVPFSFKGELMSGTHNFANGGDAFKIALYTSSASLDASTTAFTTSNEVSDSGSYSSGGGSLTSVTPTTSGTTAICDFADVNDISEKSQIAVVPEVVGVTLVKDPPPAV